MGKGKVAIYARVSTSDGKQDYNRQIDDLTKVIKREGYGDDEIEIFAESISGYKKKDDRVEFQSLLQKVGENHKYFDCIYTTEISRIGRNPTQTRKDIDYLTDLGVPVYIHSLGQRTLGENGKRNMTMNIILQVLIEYADLESETFKVRSKSGLLRNAKTGRAGGGAYLPYGYKRDEKKMLVIDDEESKVIKEIFSLYKNGNGVKVISHILNERNIPTKTKKIFSNKIFKFKTPSSSDDVKWADKQIWDIIRNSIYKGDRKLMNEIISAPPIISKELFDECNQTLKTKNNRNYISKYTFLLRHLMVCGKCGRNYYGRYKPTDTGDKVYKCSSTLIKGKSCGNCGINITLIESAIYNEIIESPITLKYLNDTKQLKSDLEKSITKVLQQIKTDEISLSEKKKENTRLLDLYLAGGIKMEKFQEREMKIDSEIFNLTERISLSKKEVSKKQKSLEGIDKKVATKKVLLKAKNNRTELQLIYSQIIHKIIVNKIDNDYALATIQLKINQEVIYLTVKLVLDLAGIRKKPIIYQYLGFSRMYYEPTYHNNILLDDVHDIRDEIKYSVDWEQIPEKYILSID